MNLLNIAKNLLDLTRTKYGYEQSDITTDEIFASKQLFEVLNSFKDSYFSELDTYDTLELADEYDELSDDEESNNKYEETTDQEDSDNEADDYNENEHCTIKNHFTLEEMQNIIEWVDEHPNASFATISHRFRKIKSMKYILRFRKYIENTGTKLEKVKQIKEFMFNEFYLKRTIEKEAVHDNDLELYAIQKARELDLDTFKASKSFINDFKRENGISSRRYNKLVTRIKSNRKVCSLNDARNWVESKRTLISKYSPDQILNSDHCSFQKEYISPRTLSFTGERTTEVAIRKKHNVTHTYTVQPVTSAAGRLLNKFLLILQEKDDEFGRIVEKNMIIPPNVIVQASKSGKSTAAKHYIFLDDVLRPFVHKKFLLFLDSWTTQTDQNKFRNVFPLKDSQLLIFPEGSTGHIQPQDLSLFRSWRYFHKKIEHYTHINRTQMNLSDRQYFINVHSIIHNQLSAPPFENLIKNGFIQAQITNETIGQVEKPRDICFKFYDLYCSSEDCDERTLLKCAWCKNTFCYYHLIEDLHLHL